MQAGNQAGAEEAQQKAEQCQQEAQALSEQAAGMVDKLKANPLGQGMIKQIAKQASDKAEEVAAMMDGWGVGSEDLTMSDATEIAQMAMAGQSALKKLSELIGRFAKISMKTAELTKAGYTGAVVEPDLTRTSPESSRQRERISARSTCLHSCAVRVTTVCRGWLAWVET